MNKILFLLLLLSAFFVLAGPILPHEPRPINPRNTTDNHTFDTVFCADNNTLSFNTTDNRYYSTNKTSTTYPKCVFWEWEEANYSDMNLTPQQILRLPVFIRAYKVNFSCLREECETMVDLDTETGDVVVIWNRTKERLYEEYLRSLQSPYP